MFVAVSAPSGAGKGTVIEKVKKDNPLIKETKSYTTKPPRREGENYNFVTVPTFEGMVSANQFLEWEKGFGGHLYGTPVKYARVEGCYIAEVTASGARQIKHNRKGLNGHNVYTVMLLPPSLTELERRLRERNEREENPLSEADIQERLAKSVVEVSHASASDFWIVNERVPETARQLSALITRLFFGDPGDLHSYRDHAVLARVKDTFLAQSA